MRRESLCESCDTNTRKGMWVNKKDNLVFGGRHTEANQKAWSNNKI